MSCRVVVLKEEEEVHTVGFAGNNHNHNHAHPFKAATATATGSKPVTDTSNNDATMLSKTRTIAELDEQEENVQKRAKFGRMDMFLNKSSGVSFVYLLLFIYILFFCYVIDFVWYLQITKSASVVNPKKRGAPESNQGSDHAVSAAASAAAQKLTKIRFKFAQGFSDAVRRPVSISEFM